MGALITKVLEGNWIYALIISFFNGQPIVSNSFWDICDIFSNRRQQRICFVKFEFY